mgnify:CR=1 FL=1
MYQETNPILRTFSQKSVLVYDVPPLTDACSQDLVQEPYAGAIQALIRTTIG